MFVQGHLRQRWWRRSGGRGFGAWLALVLVTGLAAEAAPPVRREPSARYELDPAFQASGGVQLFFELVKDSAPPDRNATFALFRPLDAAGRWDTLAAPTHVVMMRVVYELEKDASFFTERRVKALPYIQDIVPDMNVTARPDGGFRVGRLPANDFTVTFLDAPEVLARSTEPALARVLELAGRDRPPESIVVQVNEGFGRVMGARTAEQSVSWTTHQSLGSGRTRVSVLSLAYLYNTPPFFLGGDERVYRESVDGAVSFIERLRAWSEPISAR